MADRYKIIYDDMTPKILDGNTIIGEITVGVSYGMMHDLEKILNKGANQTPQEAVLEFHKKFKAEHIGTVQNPEDYEFVGSDIYKLKFDLIAEEFEELETALNENDAVEVADALGDLIYVIYGFAINMGLDLDHVVEEIHRSNMSKLGADGNPVLREDGKILKGENYSPPEIKSAWRQV